MTPAHRRRPRRWTRGSRPTFPIHLDYLGRRRCAHFRARRTRLATSSRICGHSRRWRDCGITYGGGARIRDGRDRITEALDVSRGRGALRVLAADRGLCSANCKIRPSRPGAQFFSIRRRSTRRSSGTTGTVFQIHDAAWRRVEAARAASEAFRGNRGLARSPSRAVLPSAGGLRRAQHRRRRSSAAGQVFV